MKKKLIFISASVIVISLLFTACGAKNKQTVEDNTTKDYVEETKVVKETKKEETDKVEKPIVLDYENMTAEDLIKDIKDPKNITIDEFLALMETYKYVEMNDMFERDTNITSDAFRILKDQGVNYPDITELLEKGRQSPEAVVRGGVLKYMLSLFGVNDDHVKIALDLAETEEDPYVLYTLTDVLGNELKNPGVADFIFKMSKNENPVIRRQAVYAIASPWSKGVDGTVERLLEMMEDEDEKVRRTVYGYAGRLADERVIDPIVKILMDPEQSAFHGDCMKSLGSLWIDFPLYENTSEKAYKATIEYFKFTPRSNNVPDFVAISNISTSKSEGDEGDKFKEWKEKATYYNPNELVEPMFDILKDPEVSFLACSSAIKLVKRHGSQEQFNSLLSIIESSEHPNKDLNLDAYNEELDK